MQPKNPSAGATMMSTFLRALSMPTAARICYVNPEKDPTEEMLICAAPECAAVVRAHPEWPTVPLNQDDLDELARKAGKPIECDRCGEYLTQTVDGPDPRD